MLVTTKDNGLHEGASGESITKTVKGEITAVGPHYESKKALQPLVWSGNVLSSLKENSSCSATPWFTKPLVNILFHLMPCSTLHHANLDQVANNTSKYIRSDWNIQMQINMKIMIHSHSCVQTCSRVLWQQTTQVVELVSLSPRLWRLKFLNWWFYHQTVKAEISELLLWWLSHDHTMDHKGSKTFGII